VIRVARRASPLRWFSMKEAAQIAGVSVESVRRWAQRNAVLAYKLAGTGPWRVAVDELNRLVELKRKK
jgi:excisionase family DNA binding protein